MNGGGEESDSMLATSVEAVRLDWSFCLCRAVILNWMKARPQRAVPAFSLWLAGRV